MKLGRLFLERVDYDYIVKYDLEANDAVDTRVFDLGITGQVSVMIPGEMGEENGVRTFTYKVVDKLNLAEYAKKEVNKKQMLTLLYNLTSGLESFGKNMVSLSYVAKDVRYIFVDEETQDISFIVAPVDKSTTDLAEVRELIKKILADARYFDMDRDNYVARLLTYANKPGTFSVSDMKVYINNMLGDMGFNIEEEKKARNKVNSNKVNRVGVLMNNARMTGPAQGMNGAPMRSMNGQPMNGMPMNGMPMNGQPMNGMPMRPMNGQPMNGQPMNGQPMRPMNGQPMNGQPMNGQPMNGMPMNGSPIPPMNGAPRPNVPPVPPAPNAPQTPNVPPVPPIPSAPQAPNVPPVPPIPSAPQAPNVPPIPSAPQAPNVPPVPPIPSAPQAPAKAPAPSDIQDVKTVSYEDEIPEIPEIPETPQKQEVPPIPSAPKMPNVPPVPQADDAPTPYFLRARTNEKIYINKDEFSIGKSSSKVDYTISDNNAVSRIHCIIYRRNGVSYIKDNNSTNGTFVNGEELTGGIERFLTNNMTITLGDEDFIYFVK